MNFVAQVKNKILFYFLIGIAFPCLLLGYFAFRGIQNDRALYEQQFLHKNQLVAQQVIESIHRQFNEAEKAYQAIVMSGLDLSAPALMADLQMLKTRFPYIEDFFSIPTTTGKIELPTASPLFTNQGRSYTYDFQNRLSAIPAMAEGLRNEFQKNSYPRAIDNYQTALAQSQDQNERGEILTAIARVQQKAHLFQDAIQSYQQLQTNFNNIISSCGVPLGLAAQNELGFIYLTIRDTLSAIQTYLSTFNDLSHGFWSFDEIQYQFWSRSLQDSLNKIVAKINLIPPYSSYLNKYQNIQTHASLQEKNTLRLLKFQTEAGNFITRRLVLKPIDEAQQFTVSLGDEKYFISVPGRSADKRQEQWGIIWKAEVIQDSLRHFLIKEKLHLKQIAWKVIDEEDQTILQSTNPTTDDAKLLLRTAFINQFPDWTIEFYHQDPTLIERLLSSRRSIYFYIFFLIAGILISGLYLTIRSVTHELELARLKSDFVSSVSHELKSPLTSIRQLAEMLQTGRVPSEQRRQKYYDVIVEQSKRLSLMISSVLDFARMEAGKKQFDFELTDMDRFLQEIVAVMEQRVSHDGFEVSVQSENLLPPISIDRSTMEQAITNLLDNAIKYSTKGKKIIVRLYSADQFLNISVQDFGVGIQPNELNKIFDRFYRSSNELVRSKRGSGLGLTLVKQIVKAHHGLIEVESKPGEGSTFTIKLPI